MPLRFGDVRSSWWGEGVLGRTPVCLLDRPRPGPEICPGTVALPDWPGHAWALRRGVAKAEVRARIGGLAASLWRDPKGGNYSLEADGAGLGPMLLEREGSHLDRLRLSFVDRDNASCLISACSERQVRRAAVVAVVAVSLPLSSSASVPP